MMRCKVRRGQQLSAVNLSRLLVAFRVAREQCVESFMKWVSMALAAASKPHVTKHER